MRETKQNREIKKEDSFNISSTEDISFENLSKKDFEWTRKSLLSTKDLKKEIEKKPVQKVLAGLKIIRFTVSGMM